MIFLSRALSGFLHRTLTHLLPSSLHLSSTAHLPPALAPSFTRQNTECFSSSHAHIIHVHAAERFTRAQNLNCNLHIHTSSAVRLQATYKKGDPLDPESYRPIAITSFLYKLYASMVTLATSCWGQTAGS